MDYRFGCNRSHDKVCKFVFNLYTNLGNFKVKIEDGSLSMIVGMGTIKIGPNLILLFVLHVPNLTCNLLSISKLTQDLNCVTKILSLYMYLSGLNYEEND